MGVAATTEGNRGGRKGLRAEAWEPSLFHGWLEKRRADIGEQGGAGRLGKQGNNGKRISRSREQPNDCQMLPRGDKAGNWI